MLKAAIEFEKINLSTNTIGAENRVKEQLKKIGLDENYKWDSKFYRQRKEREIC